MPVYPVKIESPKLLIGGSPPTSDSFPVNVWVKQGWDQPWILQPDIIPKRVIWSAANSRIGQAQFLYRYGKRRAGQTKISPANWMRWFIKVEFPGSKWIGQINSQPTTLLGGSENPDASGAMVIVADSLESIFLHSFVTQSAYVDYENLRPRIATALEGFTFNKDGFPNRTTETFGGGSFYFCRRQEASFWSTRAIVFYAIQNWVPRTQTGTALSVDVSILAEDLARLPNWDKPVLPTHGYRPLEIINRIVSRRRLLMWWLDLDETILGSPRMLFRTATYSSSPVTDGSGNSIPPNTKIYTIDADEDASAEILVDEDANSYVDQVTVTGAKMRKCFSMEFQGSTATRHIGEAKWTSALEIDYEKGGSDSPLYPAAELRGERRAFHARVRSQDKYRDVFARFGIDLRQRLPDPDTYYAAPFNIRMLPSLPLLEGRDYSFGAIASGTVAQGGPNDPERQPVVYLLMSSPEFGYTRVYVDATKIGRTDDIPAKQAIDNYKFSCELKVVPNDVSFRLEVSGDQQHVLSSKPIAVPVGTLGVFQQRPEDKNIGNINWREMVATVAVEDDRYCEASFPTAGIVGPAPFRRIIIDAGSDYKLDWVAPNTVVGTNDAGTLLPSTGGFFRDDRSLLQSIAERAYNYYGVVRSILRMSADYRDMKGVTPFQLGAFILSVKHGSFATRAINSPVSQVTVDFPVQESETPIARAGRPQMSLITSFGELDSSFFVGAR